MKKKLIAHIKQRFQQGKKLYAGEELHLDVLIEKDNGYFVAHCLDLDIVAQGKTVEEAKKNLIELIHDQIEFAVDNNLEELLVHSAPEQYWNKFWDIKSQGLKRNLAQKPPATKVEIDKKLDIAYA